MPTGTGGTRAGNPRALGGAAPLLGTAAVQERQRGPVRRRFEGSAVGPGSRSAPLLATRCMNPAGLLLCVHVGFCLVQSTPAMKSFLVLIEIICFQFFDKLIELSSDSGAF